MCLSVEEFPNIELKLVIISLYYISGDTRKFIERINNKISSCFNFFFGCNRLF